MSFSKFKRKIFRKPADQLDTPTPQYQAGFSSPSASRSSPPTPFPDGIVVLHDCTDATVDICFIHGLTGDRTRTWTADGQVEPWPKALLSPRLAKARILAFGYDAYVLRKSVASTTRLIDHANDLVNDLTNDRATNNAASRPIIFVAHSLGGLVCKKAILQSRHPTEPHLKSIFNCTRAIVFMGTPHEGSWMAEWAKLPATILGIVKSTNKSLLNILETDDQLLESIQVDFLAMIRELREQGRRLYVTCFFEGLPLSGAGVVVSKDSATFPGYSSISIHANHRDMVKFASADENGFKRLLGELTRWEAEISAQSTANMPVSFEAEAKLDSESESDSDEGPSDYDECLSTALDLFNLHGNGETGDERACAAISKYLKMTEQEGLLKKIAIYRKKTSTKKRREWKKLEKQAITAYHGATSRCLKSLSFPEMGVREANIERPSGNTCTWIYEDKAYKLWEHDLNTLLWIKGKPGSGKSTLMKSLALKRKGPKPDPAVVYLGFFFNARGSAAEKTPVGLYITLLHNLLREVPLATSEFLLVFLEKELDSHTGKVAWQLAEIADFFHAFIGQEHRQCIEIMVDALDECAEEEVRQVIRRFEDSIADARATGAKLRVCWSSRYYPNISLKSEHGLELQLDKQNYTDIRQYVVTELFDGKDSIFSSIREDVISRANGVFLWAVLVSRKLIQGVDQGKDERQLKELLSSIPAKLDDLFDDIFAQSKDRAGEQDDLVSIAQWILCAFQPLTFEELATALSFQNSKNRMAITDVDLSYDAFFRMKKRILHLSGGLFEIVGSPGDGNRVQVIHESVREFFLGPKGLRLLCAPSRELFLTSGHKALVVGCFRVLLAKEFDLALERSKMKDSSSTTEVWKFLTVPWQPPENTFLMNYVQDFVFEHFELSLDHFQHKTAPGSPFDSLKVRRRAFENFLRLCCSQITEDRTLRPGFSAHMQRLSGKAAALGLEDTELSTRMTFLNNLSACSSFFTPRHIFMFNPIIEVEKSKGETLLALFYLYPRSGSGNIPLSVFFATPKDHDTAYEPFISKVNFCFGMTFKTERSDPERVFKQLHSWSSASPLSNATRTYLPTVLRDWEIAENIDEFHEFSEYKGVLRDFPKARLHEYSKPTVLCIILRRPRKKYFPGVSSGADVDPGSASDSDPSDGELPWEASGHKSPMLFCIYKSVLGFGRAFLPMRSLWRLRLNRRDRDTFEADTDDESEDDQEGTSDALEDIFKMNLSSFPTMSDDTLSLSSTSSTIHIP